jgi:hypothetical protein
MLKFHEQLTGDHDSFWTDHAELFTGNFSYYHNTPHAVHAKFHRSEERYYHDKYEIIPISHPKGTRTYIMMHFYTLEPNISLTFNVKPKVYADLGEVLGRVQSSEAKGLREHQIGNAQAWYYPADRTIVLWECFFDPYCRNASLLEDDSMKVLWQQVEIALAGFFPDSTRIVTPFNDPIAKSIDEYQTFLRSLGYQKLRNHPTFRKSL